MTTQQAADTAITTESPAPTRNGTTPLPGPLSDVATARMPRLSLSAVRRALVLAVIVVTTLDITLGIVAHSRSQHVPAPLVPTVITPTVTATAIIPASTTLPAATAIVSPGIATPGIATTVPLMPLIGGAGGLLIATPSQVSPGAGPGMTQVTWVTPDGAVGQVWLSVDGKAETLFAQGVLGTQYATFTEAGRVYDFRLYTGTEHRGTPSKSVTVTRG